MEKLCQFNTHHNKFKISPENNLIILYTPEIGIIDIYNLVTLKHCRAIQVEMFKKLTLSKSIIITSNETQISGHSILNGKKEIYTYSHNCNKAFLLLNGKMLVEFNKYFKVYNIYNQEELKYNFDIYKIIGNRVIILLGKLITVFSDDFTVVKEIFIDESIKPNFAFTLYKNKIVTLNGFEVLGTNFKYTTSILAEDLVMNRSYIFYKTQLGIFIYNRIENKNTPLRVFVGEVENKYVVGQIGSDRCFLKCDEYEIHNEYLFLKKGKVIQSFKEMGINDDYIVGQITYDYIEAETEYDNSDSDENM